MRRPFKTLLALATCLPLLGCANADGSRPRLSGSGVSGPTGFNGGYAGMSGGFSTLDNTKSVPF